MSNAFRQAMVWLHTWLGLLLGLVLMVCFFFGTLSVFDREIDRWAIPQTRFAAQSLPGFDRVLLPAFRQIVPDAHDYAANMPRLHDARQGPMTPRLSLPVDSYWVYVTHRDPVLRLGASFAVPHPKDLHGQRHLYGQRTIDPRNGASVPDDALKIGSGWFYPLHYSLNWPWQDLGYWLVGVAGFAMLVALVSGVILHRKLWREFFTFRPWKQRQRSVLDLHNLTGVLALPFHAFFALTGLLIFADWLYFPVSDSVLKPLHVRYEQLDARRSGLPLQPAGVAAPLASVDAMVAEARRRWAARGMAGEVGYLQWHHVGDANGYISVYRAGCDRVALVGEGIHFKASSGEVMREDPPPSAVAQVSEFLTGLHLQHFRHWLLRWLYVLGGLLGCACIATGMVFFVGKRQRRHAEQGRAGSRVVAALAVATITGMVLATVGMLLVNRLLPDGMADKGDWEKGAFWLGWALAALHGWLRSSPVRQDAANPAWREQCLALAVAATLTVLLNWLGTGDHLLKTVFTAPYWPVAGVDLALLATAALAALAAARLKGRAA